LAFSASKERETPAVRAKGSAFRADRLERLQNAEVEAGDVQRWLPQAHLLGEHQATGQRIKQMKTFIAPLYRELSAGKGRAEALRQAQLQLLRTADNRQL
jgi:CHAT domain-containing protein